jgi:hypothetical protein
MKDGVQEGNFGAVLIFGAVQQITNKPMEDSQMTKQKVSARAPQFRIPLELLKAFKSDVRTLPNALPNNGYIVFDRAMLVSILRSNDVEARTALAKGIDELGKSGGELVIMAR